MAAVLKRSVNKFTTLLHTAPYKSCAVRASSSVNFPEHRGKWPPGLRGLESPDIAWELDEERRNILQITSAKARLEYLSGTRTLEAQKEMQFYPEDSVYMVETNPYRVIPPSLAHFRYTTKTKLLSDTLPVTYDSMDVSHIIKPLKDVALSSLNAIYKPNLYNNKLRHVFIGEILKAAMSCLCLDNEHLLRAQVDENCRWEAFWKRGGYYLSKLDLNKALRGSSEYESWLRFQLLHTCDWQIRTELPLPEVGFYMLISVIALLLWCSAYMLVDCDQVNFVVQYYFGLYLMYYAYI